MRTVRGFAARLALIVIGASLAACSSTVTKRPITSTPAVGSHVTTTAGASAPHSSYGIATTGSNSTRRVDPCALFTAGDAQSVLHRSIGSPRRVTAGDLTECAFGGAELVVAVLDGSFTTSSFQRLVASQNNGPFAATAGQGVPFSGLGDAAARFDKAGIVEALKGGTVISITSSDVASSRQVAGVVIGRLPS